MRPEDLTRTDAQVGVTAYLEDSNEGPNFETIPFRVEAEERPNLDSFVVIERAEVDDVLHYGRIGGGMERNPESDAVAQQAADAYNIDMGDVRPGDHDPKVTRVMVVELLGELVFNEEDEEEEDSVSTRQPQSLPQTGQNVYVIDGRELPELLNLPTSTDGPDGFEIGKIESGGQSAPFALSRKAIARHVAVLGRTGVGKTHTSHVLVEELVDAGVPVITFDVMDDAKPMAEALGGTTVTPGADLRIPYSLIGFEAFEEFVSYTDAQRDLAKTAYSEIHEQGLKQLREEGEIDIPYQEFYDEIEDYGDNVGSKATDRAIRSTKWGLRLSPLGTQMNDWGRLLVENAMINVDIGSLGQDERQLVIGAVGRMLQQLRRRDEVPPFVLVVDEAHKYVPSSAQKTTAGRVMRDLVQTARHDEIGTVLITQSPSTLDDVALRTANTHIVLALDSDEMSDVRGLFGDLSKETLDRIPKLEKGNAMIASARDLMRHTVPVDIRQRRTPDGAETPDLVTRSQKWKESYREEVDTGVQEGLDSYD